MRKFFLFLFIFVFNTSIYADNHELTFKAEKLKEGIHMIAGPGGNVGIYNIGNETLIVDSKDEQFNVQMLQAVKSTKPKKIQYVINTHWHWDHVGGNETLANQGATIIAHENVYKRMSTQQRSEYFNRTVEPYPTQALPKITYTDDSKIHVGDINVQLKHFDNMHTDGDTIILIPELNIAQMGDSYFTSFYPFIDVETGGTIGGMIQAVEWVLTQIKDDTIVIPGHGPATKKQGLIDYLEMLKDISKQVKVMKQAGKSLDEVKSSDVTKKYDEKWNQGYIKRETLLSTIYQTVAQ